MNYNRARFNRAVTRYGTACSRRYLTTPAALRGSKAAGGSFYYVKVSFYTANGSGLATVTATRRRLTALTAFSVAAKVTAALPYGVGVVVVGDVTGLTYTAAGSGLGVGRVWG